MFVMGVLAGWEGRHMLRGNLGPSGDLGSEAMSLSFSLKIGWVAVSSGKQSRN
jgi:hypothetical protein